MGGEEPVGPVGLGPLRETDALSAEALLFAAASNPTGVRCRDAFLAMLFLMWSSPPTGDRVPDLDDLRSLCSEAHLAAAPPLDPRLVVHARTELGSWRVHPGVSRGPLESVREWLLVARAVDDALVDQLGFGIADVVELGLRSSALQVETIEATWPSEPTDGALTVTHEEVASTKSLLREWRERDGGEAVHPLLTLDRPLSPDAESRLSKAVAFCTARVEEVVAGDTRACLFSVTSSGETLPVPAAGVLDAVGTLSLALLGGLESERRHSCGRLLRDEASRELAELAVPVFGADAIGPVSASRGAPDGIAVLVAPDVNHLVAFHLVAPLDGDMLDGAQETVFDSGLVAPGTTLCVDPEIGRAVDPGRFPVEFRERADGSYAGTVSKDTGVRNIVVVAGPIDDGLRLADGVMVAPLEQLRSILRGVADGPEEFWSFLDALAVFEPPRIAITSAADLWIVWQQFHDLGLIPAEVVLDFASGNEWEATARRDEADRHLFAHGFPWVETWPDVEVEEDGDVNLFSRFPFRLVSVIPRLGLIVEAAWDNPQPVPQLNAGRLMKDATAHALRHVLTLPDLGVAWYESTLIRFVPREGERVRLLMVGPATVVVGYDHALLRISDSAELYEAIGDALAMAVATWTLVLSEPRDDHDGLRTFDYDAVRTDPRSAESHRRFLSAWTSIPPTLQNAWEENPAPSEGVPPPTPLSKPQSELALMSIFQGIRARRVSPGRTEGPAVQDVLEADVLPVIAGLINSQLARFSQGSVVNAVMEELEKARARQSAVGQDAAMRTHRGWGFETTALSKSNELVRTIEVLLEFVVSNREWGELSLGARDYSRVMHLAWWWLDTLMKADFVRSGLYEGALVVDDSGAFALLVEQTDVLDLESYFDAYARQHTDLSAGELEYTAPPEDLVQAERSGEWRSYVPLATSLEDLRRTETEYGPLYARAQVELDAALRRWGGFGLEAMLAALQVASSLSTLAPGKLVELSIEEFVGEVCAWSTVDPDEVRSVSAFLVFRPDGPPVGTRRPRVDNQPLRASLRPFLLRDPDRLVVAPRVAHATQRIFGSYLLEGRFPWVGPTELPDDVKSALAQWKQSWARAVEDDVVDRAEEASTIVARNVTPEMAVGWGARGLPGEIDVLALDHPRKRLWVIEAKSMRRAFDNMSIARQVATFLGPEGLADPERAEGVSQARTSRKFMVDRLLAKREWASRHLNEIVTGLGSDLGDEAEWSVYPLMVTVGPHPAGFAAAPRVPFASLTTVAAVLSNDDPPSTGWQRI